jgi:hypothetical protein
MTRVHVIVEGPTEESFIKNVLASTLWARAVYLVPIVVGVPGHKGGNVNYARVKKDILLQLKQDREVCCSMMLDLYALGAGFPGTPMPPNLTGVEKATRIEQAIHEDIASQAGDLRPDHRFLPYLQVHEYEGLLFSNPEAFASALGKQNLSESLRRIRSAFETPEDINDNPNTAPSRRVVNLYPSYRKVIEGTVAAQKVGLRIMLEECPHFRTWVEALQSLAQH